MARTWYVYELVDPRNDEVFYVGKGTGNRMFEHGKNASDCNKHKHNLICKVGYDNVIRRKVAEFWDEQAAYICESQRMIELWDTGFLTNQVISTTLARPPKTRDEIRKESALIICNRIIKDYTGPIVGYSKDIIRLFTQKKELEALKRHDAMVLALSGLLERSIMGNVNV